MAKKKTARQADGERSGASFEKQLAALEGIVRRLEEEMPGLDESIRLYEEGVGNLKACQQKLDGAEARIRMLVAGGDAPELREFQPGNAEADHGPADSPAQEPPAPARRKAARKPRGRGLF
jgi:exodeoxyribonuclease VII small subunit